jgi:UDPglucose--hexose-1-phosphate uridylyltransferase
LIVNFEKPHRRLNLLTGEWVLVSPHRAQRPWLGQIEKPPLENLPPYDPSCYLCPGNSRAGGYKNPAYESTYVFNNDFPALLALDDLRDHFNLVSTSSDLGLFQVQPEYGICKVVCFSPRHDLTLPELSKSQVESVISTWIEESNELEKNDYIEYVQIFENKGAMMGCSNPHPHSQIWATSIIPNEPAKELKAQINFLREKETCLLCSYLSTEISRQDRLLYRNDHFSAIVPFWAIWPFETMVIANRHCASLTDLTSEEITGLADVLKWVTTKYDNLFEISFPYSMGLHQRPSDRQAHPEWHLHAHFYPPLLRSATVKKFMVGYEMLAMPQRDLTPESAAERLRSADLIHYRSQ